MDKNESFSCILAVCKNWVPLQLLGLFVCSSVVHKPPCHGRKNRNGGGGAALPLVLALPALAVVVWSARWVGLISCVSEEPSTPILGRTVSVWAPEKGLFILV